MLNEVAQLIQEYNHIRPDVFNKQYPDAVLFIQQITSFLPPSAPLRQRYYHIQNNIFTIPQCQYCGVNNVKWNPTKKTYYMFCSSECVGRSTVDQKKQTCLSRFGVTSPAKSQLILDKMQQTCVDRYGAINYNQTEQGKAAHKHTCMERYGVANISQITDVKNKKINTSIQKYGTNHPTQNHIQKEKVKTTCVEKYGVCNPIQVLEFAEKAKNTCMEKYGTEYVLQSDVVKNKIKQTTMLKYGTDHFMQAHIPPDSLAKSYDMTWLRDQHHIHKRTLTEIAQELQIDITSIIQRFKLFNIQTLRFGGSIAEKEVAAFLREHTSYNIIQNDREILGNLELDIWIPELNIAVEYCGLFWHSLGNPNITSKYHQSKLQACIDRGIRLITLFEDEWTYKKHIVQQKLLSICNTYSQEIVYARHCSIVVINSKDRALFLDANHIQGNGKGSITYGLCYNSKIVAVITFINKSGGVYELNRFATSCSVVGGFSKLLKHFIRDHTDYFQIYTFADRRWSEGDVYEKTGFTLDYILQPTYDYVHKDTRLHRSLFMRRFLPNKLTVFDPKLTEKQNCHINKIFQIYNCGLKKYIMHNTTTQ